MGGGSKAPAHSSDDVTAKDTVEVVHGASLKEKVEKLAFQNAMCLPPSLSQSSIANRPRRIAVCLVIVDCLIHEDLWRRWMEGGDEDISAELYIHAKHPDAITSPWVKERTLPGTFLPEWNSIEVFCVFFIVNICIPSASDAFRWYERCWQCWRQQRPTRPRATASSSPQVHPSMCRVV